MDFRRIEWIFLMVFIGLNIFLGISFFQSQQVDLATSTTDTADLLADMGRDGIKLPKLATTTPTGGYLASQPNTALSQRKDQLIGQYTTVSGTAPETLHSTLRGDVVIKEKDAATQLKKWLASGENAIDGDEYVYAEGLSSKGTYIFVQKRDGDELYDRRAEIVCTVKNERLISYTQTYIDKLTVLRSDVALASAQDAVITLYRDNELANNATVAWTKLAYTYMLDAKGSTVFVPAWFVGVETQGAKSLTVKKVNAISKTVITTRTEEQ
ncbi:two-component system regulatory protein YycI [Lacticaseibacillus mingshuiensis]|uniref:Two-component system regulatory protein YycI n=1 Tax=Lacticaseibacillus mingshuiensis TaxID=2799574 RepID=A0ABW4CI35_9LACO|nr:two-component system regulatory protein YycI [Lacticaseibacillus mingshuiensis]